MLGNPTSTKNGGSGSARRCESWRCSPQDDCRAISALLSGGAVPPAKTRRPQWPRAARRLRPWFPWGRVRSGPPV